MTQIAGGSDPLERSSAQAGPGRAEADFSAASAAASTALMNVRMVSGMMSEILRAMAEVKTHAQESEQRVSRAAAAMRESVERVASLNRSVDQIERTAGLINSIARATNILALNATIEAARAGDAGAAFSVVAGEVKALSRETAQATENVNQQLTSIHETNREVMFSAKAVDQELVAVQELVAKVSAVAIEQSGSLETVTNCASEAAQSVETIVTALERLLAAAHEISEKTRCIDQPAMT